MKASLENETRERRVDVPEVSKLAADPVQQKHFERHVAAYKAWLAGQTKEHADRAYHERCAYAERAMAAVEVGNSRIQTFTPFRYKYSALQTITRKQVIVLVLIAMLWLGSMLWNWKVAAAWTISLITLVYLSHLILDVYLALQSVHSPGEERIDETIIEALQDADWPPYTVLCPLYKEARVVPQFAKAMQAMDYPRDKLQILFLTEEDDVETRKAIFSLHLPPHFRVVTVPDGSPRTKPRACNYGLIEATGQYVVIYDAEDVPDPLQLKKAALTFANHGADLACVQAKLNFYNPEQNMLTRWFTAEYSLWFDLILPGLQKAKLAIPLGGTSNHFPVQTLRALGGWDAFNVTEDCDLGLRLSWFRLKTVIVDSTTYEEANSRVKNWIRQRSRWIKGYMQTYLVHMREPWHYIRHGRLRELFSLQVLIGGKTAILLINPLMWLLLTLTIVFRATISSVFGALFPPFILYAGVITLVLGNFFYAYIYLLGCMRREQFRLVPWMLLIPIYWFLASVAACMALYELFTRPHYWQKTIHGLHLASAETTLNPTDPEWEELARLAESLTPITMGSSLVHGSINAAPAQKYTRLEQVPVASVQDNVETMIVLHKPALLSSERAYLQHNGQRQKDHWLTITLLTALTISIAACAYFFKQNQLLVFHSIMEQVNVTRQFVVGPPMFNVVRLGGNALPLPYLMMVPFVWNDYLWHTGLAGSIPSMLCYVVTCVYVFLTARLLTRNSSISYLSSLIFMLNPTILYMQSIPVGVLVGIATLTMTGYYLLAWTQSNRLGHLLATAASVCLATLSSYNAWLLLLVLPVLILAIAVVKRHGRTQIVSNLLVFCLLSYLGAGSWLAWHWAIFGDPISFLHVLLLPAVTPPALAATSLSSYHDVWQSLRSFGLIAFATLGYALTFLSLLALVVFLLRYRFESATFAALSLLLPFAAASAALYSGYLLIFSPLATSTGIPYHLLTVSSGAELVAPAAIFIAVLMAEVWSMLQA